MSQRDFSNFLTSVGIRDETAGKLYEGNIRTPQELASAKSAKLNEIVDDSVLINTIHPVLQQYAFPITMAKDPYKKAIALLQKHCGEPEPMDTDSPSMNGLQSDAYPINGDTGASTRTTGPTAERPRAQPSNASSDQRTTIHTTFWSDVPHTKESKEIHSHGDNRNIVIKGGNFVQSNLLGQSMVIHNKNSTVQAQSFIDTAEAKQKRRSEKVDPSWIKLEDCSFSTAQLQLVSSPDYWPTDDTRVNKVEPRVADKRKDDAYPVTQWDSNRALLINITKFHSGKNERLGADIDTIQLREVLQQLGFEVTLCENKNKREIMQYVREFLSPSRNQRTSISLVFIGSHGDRTNNEDTFVGSDGQPIRTSEVIEQFNGSKCPWLLQKPKLFFFQFCRLNPKKNPQLPNRTGNNRAAADSTVHSDADPEGMEVNVIEHHVAHDEADMLQAYATAAGTKAYRDTQEGSWFVTALCNVLKRHANSDDLLSMMTKVNSEVMTQKNREGALIAVQMATFTSTLQKKVHFYPQ